jgi:hypothetical protein
MAARGRNASGVYYFIGEYPMLAAETNDIGMSQANLS